LVALLNWGPARALLAPRMRRETQKKVRQEFYPAPQALIDLWAQHGDSATAMQKAEISSFARLLVTQTAQNLVRVFFLRNNLKGLAGGRWEAPRVRVLGGACRGGDLAAGWAWQGCPVSLREMKAEQMGGPIKGAAVLYEKIGRDNRRK